MVQLSLIQDEFIQSYASRGSRGPIIPSCHYPGIPVSYIPVSMGIPVSIGYTGAVVQLYAFVQYAGVCRSDHAGVCIPRYPSMGVPLHCTAACCRTAAWDAMGCTRARTSVQFTIPESGNPGIIIT